MVRSKYLNHTLNLKIDLRLFAVNRQFSKRYGHVEAFSYLKQETGNLKPGFGATAGSPGHFGLYLNSINR